MKDKIFEFIKKVNAISHTGVTYSKCPYALDNYHELLELSTKMIHEYMQSTIQPYNVYKNVHYPTPQPCVRIVIIKNNKVLMVQENDTPKKYWTLPGGWCDIDSSPVEAALKEAQEETGLIVKITNLLAVIDRNKYSQSELYNVYNLVFLAEVIGGEIDPNYEVDTVEFFELDKLPEFSNKMSAKEFEISINAMKLGQTYFE